MQIDDVRQITLFRGMDDAEISAALSALAAKEKSYKKDETILYAGNVSEHMGLVLEGSITIESNDVWGNRTILSHIEKGGTFTETYALLEDEPMLVDVIANEKSNILFLRIGSLRVILAVVVVRLVVLVHVHAAALADCPRFRVVFAGRRSHVHLIFQFDRRVDLDRFVIRHFLSPPQTLADVSYSRIVLSKLGVQTPLPFTIFPWSYTGSVTAVYP